MPEFEVEVDPNHEHLAEICLMYWSTTDDGAFTHTVKHLADLFGEPSHRISKIVSKACFARSLQRCCSGCERGFIYRSRAQWTSGTRYTPGRCESCIQGERRRLAEARERADAELVAAIRRRHQVRDDESSIRAEDLDMPAAFALAALLEDAEEVTEGITTPVVARDDQLSPSLNMTRR
ncbi:hypothetical protein Aab01nite_82710 [Paractinoplanes abujensis]|uniref:Uncharacterized protein n=1 Tax=Paractinoplanes abujensis TaxID=882441 RepID=A0A7W7CML9_9ACTN|nr:hypothetical protein [Actinoplanes abujensis]MBB4689915.1 hypothetical protein [Actinoplanes abujensis]GID24681.1 hypothetical protein Aab01nite_82710 [Actinoplanes abujensis]